MKKAQRAIIQGIIIEILFFTISIVAILYGFYHINIIMSIVWIVSGVVLFIIAIKCFPIMYKCYVTIYSNPNWRQIRLKDEEIEIIEDAKLLLKKVNPNIIIADFNVYKVRFLEYAWFHYDENTKELKIFIPFKKYIKYGKDYCFRCVLHEILHSQNLKNNMDIFEQNFLEGLNELLTVWLIENYSEKYKISKKICLASIRINGKVIRRVANYSIYKEEIDMVRRVLEDARVDLKEVFLNYINLKPEYFKSFIPKEYFIEQ